jgi:16S rRNA (adenine1518-N6/adenine1519-N6)-dimethyltransferase
MKHQPRKRFGQHWLTSEPILHQILRAAHLSSGDRVLEIGPGTGRLTRWLLPLAAQVVAVEVDRDLCQMLRHQFRDANHLQLIEGDILQLDLAGAIAPTSATNETPLPNKVVANIPYYITGAILEKLLGTIAHPASHRYDSIVLLTQKEVAKRICANAGSTAFGALSVRVQYLAHCEFICSVPAKAFQPPPKVESAVIRLIPRSPDPIATDPVHLDRLVKLGFATKRKMLRNNLKSVVERDRLCHLLEQLEISAQARAEDLTVAQWVRLSNALADGAVVSPT